MVVHMSRRLDDSVYMNRYGSIFAKSITGLYLNEHAGLDTTF